MNTKIELLMQLTELSEQIRHSKKRHHRHEGKDCQKHEHRHNSDKYDKAHKGDSGRGKSKLSFTAKRAICILLEEESINQRSISKRLGVSAQTVSEMVKTLEGKEIIVKSQGELNNENIIALTEKGKEIAKETNKRIADSADRIFDGLSIEQLEVLGDILAKISQNNLNDID